MSKSELNNIRRMFTRAFLSSRVTPLFAEEDGSFRVKLESDDLTSITSHLLSKGTEEIPLSMGYAIISMLHLV